MKGANLETVTNQMVPEVVHLSESHLAALNRHRRIAVNYDAGYPQELFGIDIKRWVDFRFNFADEPGSQIDSLWWCLDEGNLAYYPSKVLPVTQCPRMKMWFDAGINIVKVMVEETHKRGLEAFWTYRLSGADREPDLTTPIKLPMKEQHPDWLIKGGWWKPGLWNFAVPEVREYKVTILREIAECYDFDGIDIDFARHPPCLPIGHQWEHRDAMTDFIRKVRMMLQDVAKKRNRPFLLSVRVPTTVPGCHYDGLDIETWAQQNLIDIIVMGVRSIDVDVAGFRRATAGTHIKLYPCIDDAHSTDGYHHPPIEFFRGTAANWWHEGVDGILTFNFANAAPDACAAVGFPAGPPSHQQAYQEIGEPEVIRFENKIFTVQRRFGAGWEERWDFYHNNNVQAPLPAVLSGGAIPTILTVNVADDLTGNAERLKSVELRLLLSGVADKDVVEVKLNGILLHAPILQGGGWRIFSPTPRRFAVGRNLVSIRIGQRPPDSKSPIVVEKLEVHVAYKSQ